MPFGGYKASGLGRENGSEAIEVYLQSKSVWINNGAGRRQPLHHENIVVRREMRAGGLRTARKTDRAGGRRWRRDD